MANSLITIAELQTFTNKDFTADYTTSYLNTIIGVVSDLVETFCQGTLFEPATITDERGESHIYGATGEFRVKLNYAPLISVSTLKYRIGASESTIDTSNADLNLDQSEVTLLWGLPTWRKRMKIVTITTYMAGLTTIPDMVKRAVALLVQEAIDSDDQAKDGAMRKLSGYRIGNYAEDYVVLKGEAEIGNLGLGTTRAMLASQLLSKYRRPGVVR